MKNLSLRTFIAIAGMIVISLIASLESRSQQLITFTNGSALKVFITYQTKDTIQYYKPEAPTVIYTETMDHVLKIEAVAGVKDYQPTSQAGTTIHDKEYWKYKKNIKTGGIMMGTGAVLGIAGILGWSGTHKAEDADQVLGAVFSVMGMIMGTGLFVSGGIILAVNSSSLSAYKREQGLSLKIKCTPQVQGISLVYNF